MSGINTHADDLNDAIQQKEWQLREQQEQQEQERRDARPDVRIDLPEPAPTKEPYEEKEGCFNVKEIIFQEKPPKEFGWLLKEVEKYRNSCISQKSLSDLVKNINKIILSKGYVTSRLGLPEQNLSSGQLLLALFPGKVDKVISGENYIPLWQTAFPIRQNDILNIRAMEQGLEQMKRLPTQDVTMEIQPADETGYSNINLDIDKKIPFILSLSIDDSGSENTGYYQGGVNLTWDNPLFLQDQLSFGLNQAVENDSKDSTRSNNIYYSIPYGYWLIELSHNQFDYHQLISGSTQDFMSSGEGIDNKFDIIKTVYRSNKSRINLFSGLTFRKRHNYINDTEVKVQQRRLTHVQLGIRQRAYFNKGLMNLSFEINQGTDWLDAEKRQPGKKSPNPEYTIWKTSISFNHSFNLETQRVSFLSNWKAQWASTPIYSLDWFSVGGRYSVRGFDGNNNLGGEKGWQTRNELSWFINKSQHSLFWAVDVGGVYGKGSDGLDQNWLSGIAMGLRGQLWKFRYDAFIAQPVSYPESFDDLSSTGGFVLSWVI
ncbi:ShlB/FhaC/HecB family hemolysin secretion/activation protein [Marinospirillum sp.]|uniref:ShlB/FhaC/HecB family hemolysin secretion/activation protein n=1 Tax=Marinospirillum sp. TaxID=2183934 RepID=UPI002870280D|nr:ShlB/FhaC/HecB family hemolysin secretion/activation protein [Marinospirillum sp.]